eukprot:gene30576-5474_t
MPEEAKEAELPTGGSAGQSALSDCGGPDGGPNAGQSAMSDGGDGGSGFASGFGFALALDLPFFFSATPIRSTKGGTVATADVEAARCGQPAVRSALLAGGAKSHSVVPP